MRDFQVEAAHMQRAPLFACGNFSFTSKITQRLVALNITNLRDRYHVVVSDLGKIGHVVDIIFPREYAELSTNVTYHRPDYETKIVFGPDTVGFSFVSACRSSKDCAFRVHTICLSINLFAFCADFESTTNRLGCFSA